VTARVQAHRARRLAAGLCARCGKVPPTQGRKACLPCRRADAARMVLWRSEGAPAPREVPALPPARPVSAIAARIDTVASLLGYGASGAVKDG